MRNMNFNFLSPLPSSMNPASNKAFSDVDISPSEESQSWIGDSLGGVQCGKISDPDLLSLFTSQSSQLHTTPGWWELGKHSSNFPTLSSSSSFVSGLEGKNHSPSIEKQWEMGSYSYAS